MQRRLANALWLHQLKVRENEGITSKISHAFEKGKGIITNAQVHRNKRFVLNIDLQDFFPSFHFGRVRGYFQKNRHFQLNDEVSTVLAQLTCYEGSLPQGAPTSPILANLISQIMDMRILKIAQKYRLDYTRYADDLTFSTNDWKFADTHPAFYQEIEHEIQASGFLINEEKTNFMYGNSRKLVTGLVVNQKVNVIHPYYRNVRAMAHSLYQTGFFIRNGKRGTLNQLEGMFSFINQLDRHNNTHHPDESSNKSKQAFRNLNGREKQYQKFLFYKYFYANQKPLIVTEGKTDIRYIKAALKSFYTQFPDLIGQSKNNTFEFRVSFLHRTKRLRYFLGIEMDGADTNTQFIKNFLLGDKPNDYYAYLMKLSQQPPRNPIVFVFDHERSKGKPLKTLADSAKLELDGFKQSLSSRLERNVYVCVPPLVHGKAECEMEDLFSEQVLKTEINGRSFDRHVQKGDPQHYGKEDFSKYVYEHYQEIDFRNFFPLLIALQFSIQDYKEKKHELAPTNQ